MKDVDEIKTRYVSHESVICDFTKEKKLTFSDDGCNEILKEALIFHPEYGFYRVTKDIYGSIDSDCDTEDDVDVGEMILVKSVEDLVAENKILIITKHEDYNDYKCFTHVYFYLYDGTKFKKITLNSLLVSLLKRIDEKDLVIREKDAVIEEQKQMMLSPGGAGYEILLKHFYGDK